MTGRYLRETRLQDRSHSTNLNSLNNIKSTSKKNLQHNYIDMDSMLCADFEMQDLAERDCVQFRDVADLVLPSLPLVLDRQFNKRILFVPLTEGGRFVVSVYSTESGPYVSLANIYERVSMSFDWDDLKFVGDALKSQTLGSHVCNDRLIVKTVKGGSSGKWLHISITKAASSQQEKVVTLRMPLKVAYHAANIFYSLDQLNNTRSSIASLLPSELHLILFASAYFGILKEGSIKTHSVEAAFDSWSFVIMSAITKVCLMLDIPLPAAQAFMTLRAGGRKKVDGLESINTTPAVVSSLVFLYNRVLDNELSFQ